MKKPYVIEISAISDCEDDDDAERVGKAVADAVRRLRLGQHVPVGLRREIRRIKSVTVAHVDPDFLAETA